MNEKFAWLKAHADDALAQQRYCERRAQSFWSWLFRDRKFWRKQAEYWRGSHQQWSQEVVKLKKALETVNADSGAHGPGKEKQDVECS